MVKSMLLRHLLLFLGQVYQVVGAKIITIPPCYPSTRLYKYGVEFVSIHQFCRGKQVSGDTDLGGNLKDSEKQVFHLQKICFLPEMQGMGLGRQMIADVVSRVKQEGGHFLQLNVNRFNQAKAFYMLCREENR